MFTRQQKKTTLEKNMRFLAAVYLSGLATLEDWTEFLEHFDEETLVKIKFASTTLLYDIDQEKSDAL